MKFIVSLVFLITAATGTFATSPKQPQATVRLQATSACILPSVISVPNVQQIDAAIT